MASSLLPPSTGPRLIVYHQTFHDADGTYHSLLPLLTRHTGITHVILAALHLNHAPGHLTLNDHVPDDDRYAQLWGEVRWLQGSGVKVLGMLGGAAKGTFERLSGDEESFEAYYRPLHAFLQQRALNGLDLDIEEEVALSVPTRLIARLRHDFGPAFLITLAPVASALLPDPSARAQSWLTPAPIPATRPNPLLPTMPHLSGFSYPQLECSPAGRHIAWYNVQFYCGWGDAASTDWYDAIIAAGWAPRKIVLGVVTNPRNGAGYVGVAALAATCAVLRGRYEGVGGEGEGEGEGEGDGGGKGGGFGGVMGWEYFNAGGAAEPRELAALTGEAETAVAGAGVSASSSSTSTSTSTHTAATWVKALGRVLRAQNPILPAPKQQQQQQHTLTISPEQIRAMLTSRAPPPPPSSSPQQQQQQQQQQQLSWPDANQVATLEELGFARHEAIAALRATDGNVELAAGFLFEEDRR